MSTTRLMVTKISDTISRYAAMIGISTFCTARTNNNPMPGHWNTVSVMMANAITEPNCSPATVMTGTSVFFSAHQPHDQGHLEQAERDRRHDHGFQARHRQQPRRPPAKAHHVSAAERG